MQSSLRGRRDAGDARERGQDLLYRGQLLDTPALASSVPSVWMDCTCARLLQHLKFTLSRRNLLSQLQGSFATCLTAHASLQDSRLTRRHHQPTLTSLSRWRERRLRGRKRAQHHLPGTCCPCNVFLCNGLTRTRGATAPKTLSRFVCLSLCVSQPPQTAGRAHSRSLGSPAPGHSNAGGSVWHQCETAGLVAATRGATLLLLVLLLLLGLLPVVALTVAPATVILMLP